MVLCEQPLITSIQIEFVKFCHEKTSIGMLVDLRYCDENP